MPFLPIVASCSSEKSRTPHNERPQSYIIYCGRSKKSYIISVLAIVSIIITIIHICRVGNPPAECIYAPVAALVLLLYPGRLCDAIVSVRVRIDGRSKVVYNIYHTILYKGEKKALCAFFFFFGPRAYCPEPKSAGLSARFRHPDDTSRPNCTYIYTFFRPFLLLAVVTVRMYVMFPPEKRRARSHNDTRRLRCINILICLCIYIYYICSGAFLTIIHNDNIYT